MKTKKYKIVGKKTLKDKNGVFLGDADKSTGKIRINLSARAHKDKAELASTIKHEIMHVNNPNMTEKDIYKKTAKTKISPQEQTVLLSKLNRKEGNYKIGAMKRKLGMGPGDFKPGEMLVKLNEKRMLAIKGLV